MWFLVVVGLFGIASGAPQLQSIQPAGASQPYQQGSGTTPIPIVAQVDSQGLDGSFNSSYETGNGIRLQQSGFVKRVILPRSEGDGRADAAGGNQETDVQVQVGSYSYTAPDGTVISLSYTADENGFQPVGDHLPTSPPIPEAILQSLHQDDPNAQIQARFAAPGSDASQPAPSANFEVLKP